MWENFAVGLSIYRVGLGGFRRTNSREEHIFYRRKEYLYI